ncbi:MAG TPA: DUF4333 domain-containing protein [Nakamurella sp.]
MKPRHLKTSAIIIPICTLTVGFTFALGVGAFLRWHDPVTVFDQQQLTAGVAAVINGSPPAGYGLTDATDVVCPADVTVKAGTAFRCTLQIAGTGKSVDVVVAGDDHTAGTGGPASGEYHVALPL